MRPWLFHQIAVEVRYRRGMVYLDRCGSTLHLVEDALGPPFQGSVPQMDRALVVSNVEHLTVSYGPDRFGVTQIWPQTRARLEPIAKAGWKVVGESLGVLDQVSRVGVRCWIWFPVESAEDGHRRLQESGLFRVEPTYAEIFGSPKIINTQCQIRTPDGVELRIGTDVVTITAEKDLLPANLVDRVPDHAVLLDIDAWTTPTDRDVMMFSAAKLTDFLRAAMKRAATQADQMVTVLKLEDASDGDH